MGYEVAIDKLIANTWRPIDYTVLDRTKLGETWIHNFLDMYFLGFYRWN